MAGLALRTQVATRPIRGARRRWGPVQYLALFGAALLGLQAYVYAAWLSAGPREISRFRDTNDISWVLARAFEAAVVAGFVVCVIYVWRKSRRERRLTFDAKLLIAGFSVVWLDEWTNFAAPIWFYSSQWLNLGSPTGYVPGVVNPVMKQLPFPLFHFFNYPVALLVAGVVVSWLIGRVRVRWPRLSTAQLIGLAALAGMCFDVAYEMPMFRLRLWAFPGSPDWLSLFGGSSMKFPVFEIVPAGLAFATFGALRFFTDREGRRATERGIDHLTPRRRTAVSVLALVGLVQLVWLACTSIQVVGGFYAASYRPMPAYLVNGICDAPLTGGGHLVGTRYGPCPHEGGKYPVRFINSTSATSPCVAGRPTDAPPVPWPRCRNSSRP